MKCFLTGITGFIGTNLARQLMVDGHQVHAIIRNPGRTDLPDIPGIKYYKGDLHDKHVLLEAMKGCEVAYHLAAFAKPWARDRSDYYRINVEGAINVFSAAQQAGVKKVVFTSSAATMSPSPGTDPVDESRARDIPYFNLYESTKAEAEEKAKEFSRNGLPVVTVNPSRVFGPGPINPSNSVTRMILSYQRGKWRIIPGDGKKVGNYVYIDDVVHGHILAAMYGKAGERYILGGDNLTFDEFFKNLEDVCHKHHRMFHLPLPVMTAAASLMEAQAAVTGIPPLITASFVKKYLNHWSLNSNKALQELGYKMTPFREGVLKTLEWASRTQGTAASTNIITAS
jgi:farnesol dehydrogenase